ncbi:MAG: hypothetical protein ACXABY_21005 [Candidatus Thorarchaeota archaeon]|jgi:hypothetical protein
MGYLGSDAIGPRLQGWIEQYGLKTLVETGLEHGRSMAWATTNLSGIEKFISIEIDYKWIASAEKIGLMHHDPAPGNPERKLLDARIVLLHGESVDKLPDAISVSSGNILWWLDAHTPKRGAQFEKDKVAAQEELLKREIAFPLDRELEIIKSHRDISGDVFLIDDMRLYDKSGSAKWYMKRGYDDPGSSVFITRELEPTHIVTKEWKDSGYLIALPR